MGMSVYRVIDVIGTSPNSWEEAAKEAVTTSAGSVRDLRVAEVTKQDVQIGDAGHPRRVRRGRRDTEGTRGG
jgi:dodecin